MSNSKHVFFRDGTSFTIGSKADLNMTERLPVGTYRVALNPLKVFYLQKVEDFTTPAKLYGHTNEQAERILRTFLERDGNTGAMLSGAAGAGKTVLAKRVSQLGAQHHDIVTILVNDPFCGDEFNAFISQIEQPAIFLFDEFEKTYDSDDQQKMLTVFDGVYSSRKLFMLTLNDRNKLDRNIVNRPGRMYYALDFQGLDQDFIREYCDDNLKNEAHLNGILVAAQFFWQFSFDMLKALVEEMNRYGENATDAMKMLNMKPMSSLGGTYTVTLLINGHEAIVDKAYSDAELDGSPIAKNGYTLDFHPISVEVEDGPDRKRDPREITDHIQIEIDAGLLEKAEVEKNTFVYGTEYPHMKLLFKRKPPVSGNFDYDTIAR
jgi:hypothetical protein